MTGRVEPAAGQPTTGHPQIDAALADLTDIDRLGGAEQLSRLSAAHEVLVRVLETSRQAVPMPAPGTQQR